MASCGDDSRFDPAAKEAALQSEAGAWDTSTPVDAHPDDIPTVDVGPFFATGSSEDLQAAAAVLREASERVGFHQLVGHGIDAAETRAILDATARFHALDDETRRSIEMDREDWPLRGSGFLKLGERKLPRRAKGNLNEAFLLKGDEQIGFDDNQWLPESAAPGFRAEVERYQQRIQQLALDLLPVYAAALDLEPDFFTPAFHHPFWRLRLSHYPGLTAEERAAAGDDAFGIAPHVDTTFFTLLLQGGPGLTIYSAERDQWVNVPVVDGAFVVNSGELLRQWSNDRFLSTRHFAQNTSGESRYSVPFFFNATADFVMECLPSCHGPDNPPKYPPISYLQSQGVVQGE